MTGNWRMMLASAVQRLLAAGIENAVREADWLGQRAGGFERAELAVALDKTPNRHTAQFFEAMVTLRSTGMPLQYVMGRWGFRTLELYVDRRVLIPRPETEMLVERALAECANLDATVAVDLGTGSGAIALALAVERPELREIWATDLSDDALAVARANLAGRGRVAGRVRLTPGSWFAALPEELRGGIDVVVSNPPYVAEVEVPDLPDEVRQWEPTMALVAGADGLDDVRVIVAEAPVWLGRPGTLLLEIAPHQAAAVVRLAKAAGFSSVAVWPDLTGRDRILQARL